MTERRNGFTLIEVLVALAILAAAMGFAFEAMSGGLSGIERSHRQQQALQLAQSLLARLGHDMPLQAAHLTGAQEGLGWVVDIQQALADPAPAGNRAAYPATVTVSWPDGAFERHIRLDTVRLGPLDTRS